MERPGQERPKTGKQKEIINGINVVSARVSQSGTEVMRDMQILFVIGLKLASLFWVV